MPLSVAWNFEVQDIIALIDTGFGGELKISPKMVGELGLSMTHTETVLLANQTVITMPASLCIYGGNDI